MTANWLCPFRVTTLVVSMPSDPSRSRIRAHSRRCRLPRCTSRAGRGGRRSPAPWPSGRRRRPSAADAHLRERPWRSGSGHEVDEVDGIGAHTDDVQDETTRDRSGMPQGSICDEVPIPRLVRRRTPSPSPVSRATSPYINAPCSQPSRIRSMRAGSLTRSVACIGHLDVMRARLMDGGRRRTPSLASMIRAPVASTATGPIHQEPSVSPYEVLRKPCGPTPWNCGSTSQHVETGLALYSRQVPDRASEAQASP